MKYIFTLIISLVFSQLIAQKQCATMEMDSLLRAKHPELGTLNEFERSLQRKIVEIKARQAQGRTEATVITIPIVVHIVHNGEAVGAGRNISEAQVKSQIETLNDDFRRRINTRGFNNDARGADLEIEFCLAQFDPNGRKMAEPGIDRVNGGRASWNRSDIEGVLKPSSSWDPNKYYNIWTLEYGAPDNNLLGYAQFPSQSGLGGIPTNGGGANTDGVTVLFSSFGNIEKGTFPGMRAPYNLGRTLAHETGHWLGLRHIWGDASCGDDFCADTPSQSSESRGCAKGRVSCGGQNMVENYMDYSDDICMNIFTNDQKARIRAVMELSTRRNSLLSSTVCGQSISARPIPNFQAENRTVLLGGQVRFTDLSTSFPTSWKWEFEGGDPTTSTEQNPVVSYSGAGLFKVTLTVSNTVGSASATKSAYVSVLNQGLCATLTNFRGTNTVIPNVGGTGYISGQNSRKIKAVSEYFDNTLGYVNLRGASIKFGIAKAAKGKDSESIVRITAWNARGFQNGPGAALETKEIPLRKILDDVANNRTTNITFDKNLPTFGLPFHLGVEFDYAAGDSIALATSKNGESTSSTSWEQTAAGEWDRFIVRNGLNVAHNISVNVGMKPSVQISTSQQFLDPFSSTTLIARGGSVYAWKPADGLSSTIAPQITAQPSQTTTYTVKSSGSDVCIDSASVTLYVRNIQILATQTVQNPNFTLSPNPTDGQLNLKFTNSTNGKLTVRVYNLIGSEVGSYNFNKTTDTFNQSFMLPQIPSGTYIIEMQLDKIIERRKILKF